MKRFFLSLSAIMTIRFLLSLFLQSYPPATWPVINVDFTINLQLLRPNLHTRIQGIDLIRNLDIDLFWTSVRLFFIGWVIVRIAKNHRSLFARLVLSLLLTIPIVGDWYWNARTQCYVQDNSIEGTMQSISLDFAPVIGDLKGLTELANGCDAVTGEKLGSFRWFGLLGIVGLAEVGTVGDVAKLGANVAEVGLKNIDNIAVAGMRNFDEPFEWFAKSSKEVGEHLIHFGREAGENFVKHSDEFIGGIGRTVDNWQKTSDATKIAKITAGSECSFSAETLVWTDLGPKAISTVTVGDKVLAYDERSRQNGHYTVTATYVHTDTLTQLLTFEKETVTTTPEHPFFTSNGWLSANAITTEHLVWRSDGQWESVENSAMVFARQPMHNLSIEVAHTFYVGKSRLLVHNTCIDKIADTIASRFDSKLEFSDNNIGWKINIPYGKKSIVVRIMESSTFHKEPYFRVSVDKKGAITREGIFSNDPAKTHHMLSEFSSNETVAEEISRQIELARKLLSQSKLKMTHE